MYDYKANICMYILPCFVFSLTLFYIVYVCICVCMYMYLSQHMCRGQKTTCKIQFSPSTVWILDIELRSSSLGASALSSSFFFSR